MECAGYWRGCHGQDIHFLTQHFQSFLVLDPKSLLLIDNHQPQIFETYILAYQPVRSHHNVHRAFGESLEDAVLFGMAPETV